MVRLSGPRAGILFFVSLGCLVLALTGCSKDEPEELKADPAQLESYLQSVESRSQLAKAFGLRQLADLGPQAEPALPRLKQLRDQAKGDIRLMFEDTIAKIEGSAPPEAAE